jgi:uncharacterized membrane protein YdbT with pleckstrin-like domain
MAPMDEEQGLWKGSPSQVVNLGTYLLCLLLFWLVVPLLYALWRWIDTRLTEYELTSQRLVFRSGIFNRKTEEIELYRVRDSSLDEPLLLRLFGAGNVVLYATDSSTPTLVLRAVQGAADVRQKLRAAVETARDQKRVRSLET